MTAYVLPVLFGGTAPGLDNIITNTDLGQTREFWQDNCMPSGRSDACTIYAYGAAYGCDGCTHPGSDVDTDVTERLYAVTDGVVTHAGVGYNQAGRVIYCPVFVMIQPTVGPYKDERHIYGHMGSVSVATNQSVKRGQLIGYTGDVACGCGGVACPHVHWERNIPNSNFDPVKTHSSGYESGATHGAVGSGPLTDPNANGTTVNPPPDPVVTTFKYGDIAKATTSVNVRATPAGTVIGSITTGTRGEILSENQITASLSGTSYTWAFINVLGRALKGWVATTNLARSVENRIVNPHFQTSGVTGVSGKNGGVASRATSASRNLVATGGGSTAYTDWWLTVTCDGTQPFQGVYLRSNDVNITGRYRTASGHISIRNISSGDYIKYVGIRVIYSDGSFNDRYHPSQPTGAAEQRISIPPFAISTTKKVFRAQFYTYGANDTGNPRSWQINRAIVYLDT